MRMNSICKKLLAYTAVAIIVASCTKPENTDNGTGMIQGHAFYVDSTLSTVPKPLKNKTIFLEGGTNNTPPVTTDSTGYFSFPYLKGCYYKLYATYYNGAKMFSGNDTINLNSGQNRIIPAFYLLPSDTVITFVFQDNLRNPLARVPFSIFTNPTFAAIDSTRYALLNAKSDSIGLYKAYNLPKFTYYITSRIQIGLTLYSADQTVTYSGANQTYTITLNP
jgi:hypothetical protein